MEGNVAIIDNRTGEELARVSETEAIRLMHVDNDRARTWVTDVLSTGGQLSLGKASIQEIQPLLRKPQTRFNIFNWFRN